MHTVRSLSSLITASAKTCNEIAADELITELYSWACAFQRNRTEREVIGGNPRRDRATEAVSNSHRVVQMFSGILSFLFSVTAHYKDEEKSTEIH